jgi:uncharacterized membrane protein YhaH (DUF805 family)
MVLQQDNKTMFTYLKKLYNLGWKTSIGPQEYAWAIIANTLLFLLFCVVPIALFSGVAIAAHFLGATPFLVNMLWKIGALTTGLVLIVAGLFFLWWGLKLAVNRIHSFGTKAWPWLVGYFLAVFMLPFTAAFLAELGFIAPYWNDIAGSLVAILGLLCTYILFFEEGTSARYPRSEIWVVSSWGWGKSVLLGFYLFLTVCPSVFMIFQYILNA